MPSIELYLDVPDLPLLEQFLNHDPEIAFVLPSHDGSFAIVETTVLQPNGLYTLWHTPSGEIPSDCRDRQGRIITDPAHGVHLGSIRLCLEVCPGKYMQLVPRNDGNGHDLKIFADETAIGRSSFLWCGNRFKPIGKSAHQSTERWWNRMKRWVAKHGQKVTWSGSLEEPRSKLRVWAFPFAYAAFKAGRNRSINPLFLSKGGLP